MATIKKLYTGDGELVYPATITLAVKNLAGETVDEILADLETQIGTKANTSTTYTKTEVDNLLANYDLSAYATQTWVENKGYLTEVPSTYALKTDVTDALTAYTTTEALNTTLSSYATDEELSNALTAYTKTDDLTGQLTAYTTTEALNTALADYVANTSLTETLQSYATDQELSDALTAYTTTADMTALLDAKANSADVYTKTESDAKYQAVGSYVTEEQFNTLVSGGTTGVIDNFNEITAFLSGFTDSEAEALKAKLDAKQDKLTVGDDIINITDNVITATIPSEYINETELADTLALYATSQDLSDAISGYTVTWDDVLDKPDLAAAVHTHTGSEVFLSGYTIASSAVSVTSADTVNAAIGKIEYKADSNTTAISAQTQNMLKLYNTNDERIASLEKVFTITDISDNILSITDSESVILVTIGSDGLLYALKGAVMDNAVTEDTHEIGNKLIIDGTKMIASDDNDIFYIVDSDDNILFSINSTNGEVDFNGIPTDIAAKFTELESSLTGDTSSVDALQTQIDELEATVTAQTETITTLSSTVESQATSITTMQSTIDTQAASITSLEARVTALEEKIAALGIAETTSF